MLEVQKFLQRYPLKDLESKHGVGYKICDHKLNLNYNQIKAKDGDRIAEECRGLILSENDFGDIPEDKPFESRIVAYPFRRFYNYGQGAASKISIEDSFIEEKLDGTLCILYFDYYKFKWCVATRSVPEADLEVQGFDFTFTDLFEKALSEQYGTSIKQLYSRGIINEDRTYAFELTSPFNQVVVQYPKTELTLLLQRSNISLLEEQHLNDDHFFRRPKKFQMSSIDDVVSFVNDRNPIYHEGIVLVEPRNKKLLRVKVKSLSYVAYNKAFFKIGASYRNCLSLVLEESVDDVAGKLPLEIEKIVLDMQSKTRDWLSVNEEVFDRVYKESVDDVLGIDMKKFADLTSREAVKNKSLWTAAFFEVARGKSPSIRDAILKKKPDGKYKNSLLDNILEHIGYK